MKEEENIVAYFFHVDEIVNTIKALGEFFYEIVIVQKMIRSLLVSFDPKVSTIE